MLETRHRLRFACVRNRCTATNRAPAAPPARSDPTSAETDWPEALARQMSTSAAVGITVYLLLTCGQAHCTAGVLVTGRHFGSRAYSFRVYTRRAMPSVLACRRATGKSSDGPLSGSEEPRWMRLRSDLWVLAQGHQPLIVSPNAQPSPHLKVHLEEIVHFDLSPRLHEIRPPTLVVCGRHDPVAPPAFCSAIRDGIAYAELLVLERAEHGLGSANEEDLAIFRRHGHTVPDPAGQLAHRVRLRSAQSALTAPFLPSRNGAWLLVGKASTTTSH
jgi:pimeloyl-ACP methyl ester carboxylesterase